MFYEHLLAGVSCVVLMPKSETDSQLRTTVRNPPTSSSEEEVPTTSKTTTVRRRMDVTKAAPEPEAPTAEVAVKVTNAVEAESRLDTSR